ncbi:MAG: AbrB/MazE/SpoVT family DNA-binding domain-containing protein [Candidatus Gracilibacteria bacterium]|jgi:AbrB family looped-hinge helix DNA binding protein
MKKIRIVRTQSKGMVTIPAEFRQKLGINENSLLEAKIVKKGILFLKINYNSLKIEKKQPGEIYSEKQIQEWLLRDKLDARTQAKVKKLLNK